MTHTQKKKLQHLRRQKSKEQEVENLRGKQLDKYKPLDLQSKVWRVKAADQPVGLIEPPQLTGLTGTADRSDRLKQPVRPTIESAVQYKPNR